MMRVLSSLALALAVTWPALASEKRPLPEATVLDSAGRPMALTGLGVEGRWLLILVGIDAAPSARLVAALKEWQAEVPQLGARAVLVFSGSSEGVRQFVEARGSGMPDVRWGVDADGSAAAALRLSAVPALVGVANGRIEWVVAGVLNDPATIQPVVTGWVTR